MPVEEYLRMNFEGSGPEYLDGELIERSTAGVAHSSAQVNLIACFGTRPDRYSFRVYLGLHLRTAPNRIRIADIAVFPKKPADEIPFFPPHIAIEIVSPGDRYTEIHQQLKEYQRWGVKNVWLLNPASEGFSVYDDAGLREVPALELPELELTIQKSDVFE